MTRDAVRAPRVWREGCWIAGQQLGSPRSFDPGLSVPQALTGACEQNTLPWCEHIAQKPSRRNCSPAAASVL